MKVNSTSNPIHIWIRELNLKSISRDDFPLNKINQYLFLAKLDGELNCLIYERNKSLMFLTRSDTVRMDLYVLDEYKTILDNSGVNSIIIMGEGVAVKNDKILPFNEIQSILKTAYKNAYNNSIYHHFPYDIYSINGVRQTGKLEDKLKLISKLFNGSRRIHVPLYVKGDLGKAWNSFSDIPGVEGLVARDHINYKIKKTFTFDLAVIAVGNISMKTWSRNEMSYLKVAFMDKPNEFILATNIGTGFNREDRIKLFKWAQENKIEERNDELWVSPSLVIESQWIRIRKTNMLTYKYIKNVGYKYIGKNPGYSLMHASFKSIREDKRISIFDIGFRQIPTELK